MNYNRSCGFCLNEKCDDEHRGVFLLNHGAEYWCNSCRVMGRVIKERGSFKGEGKFREVRIEFDYDSQVNKFRQVAIVLADDTAEGKSFLFRSPLIRTDKRALKVAEGMLANLRRRPGIQQGDIPTQDEMILCWDASKEDIQRTLRSIESYWCEEDQP